ncbi:flavoprotein-like protein [Spinellus fusiger]|nr:flavoprotein-like protein [Spinellus fusiger]
MSVGSNRTTFRHRPKAYIIIYSLCPTIYKLSLAVRNGLLEEGVEATVYQAIEASNEEQPPQLQGSSNPDIPVIQPHQLVEADGILFGVPTRFGSFPVQFKSLLGKSSYLWATGALQGKFAATFYPSLCEKNSSEIIALSAMTYFAYHGMLFVPFGIPNANRASVSTDKIMGKAVVNSNSSKLFFSFSFFCLSVY